MQAQSLYDKFNKKLQELNDLEVPHNLSEPNAKDIFESQAKSCPTAVKKRAFEEAFHYGPITQLLNDDHITEIFINSQQSIYYEKDGTIHKHSDGFFNQESYYNFLYKICDESQEQFNSQKPYAQGTFGNNYRFQITSAPITTEINVTIRKPLSTEISFSQWTETSVDTNKVREQILNIFLNKKNILVIGPTSSGKTTAINALLSLCSKKERVILIEDTKELRCPNSLSVGLSTTNSLSPNMPEIDYQKLIKLSLRMRPDRLVLGELRGAEAKDFLILSSSGHRGSMTSLHAQNPHEALLRLEMLIQLGAPQWAIESIRKLIFLSVNYIILMENKKGQRKVAGLYKLSSLDGGQYLIDTVYATTSR